LVIFYKVAVAQVCALSRQLVYLDLFRSRCAVIATGRRTIMFRWLIWLALGALVAGSAATLFAQPTTVPKLPAWNDKASVYLAMSEKPAPAVEMPAANVPGAAPNETAAVVDRVDVAAPTAAISIDATATPSDDYRRLAPPSSKWNDATTPTTPVQAANGGSDNPWRSFGVPRGTVYKIASALAIVVGLFLVFAWLVRRGARNVGRTLPADVVCALGRVPLAGRQFADLLHVGNKLVLVASSPAGPATLTEVTEPTEVDRLVGLCRQADPHSTTKAFEQVFRQLARDPAPIGFLENEGLPATFAPPIEAFRLPRGDLPRA
jgi:flagellar biogenesis protein FliO